MVCACLSESASEFEETLLPSRCGIENKRVYHGRIVVNDEDEMASIVLDVDHDDGSL